MQPYDVIRPIVWAIVKITRISFYIDLFIIARALGSINDTWPRYFWSPARGKRRKFAKFLKKGLILCFTLRAFSLAKMCVTSRRKKDRKKEPQCGKMVIHRTSRSSRLELTIFSWESWSLKKGRRERKGLMIIFKKCRITNKRTSDCRWLKCARLVRIIQRRAWGLFPTCDGLCSLQAVE